MQREIQWDVDRTDPLRQVVINEECTELMQQIARGKRPEEDTFDAKTHLCSRSRTCWTPSFRTAKLTTGNC